MSCYNGKTFLNSLVPFPGSTAGEASYLASITHYTCNSQRICANESFPITSNLSYKVVSVNPAGDGLYDLNLLAVGTVSYKSTCSTCPVTETIYTYLSIPVTSNEGIVVTANNESCSLNGISCNCNTSSSINIVASFTVETKIAAAEASDESGD